ncbi:MAG: FAD-binding oxidoreductase [Bacteroidota bacterium]
MGGGLAGSFLAAESLRAGHRVRMVDAGDPNAASRVAAGLYNVITGRAAKRTWLAETLLEHLYGFFEQPTFAPLRAFLHPMPIYRPFRALEEVSDWELRLQEPAYAALAERHTEPRHEAQIHNGLGGLLIKPCGWLDTTQFLAALHLHLTIHFDFALIREHFDYEALDPATGKCTQEGLRETFDEVVFAEGVGTKNNPWFHWLDIRPLKGQIMDIHVPEFEPDFVLLRKVFMIPHKAEGENFYTVGSTYEKYFDSTAPTEKGRAELCEHVEAAIKLPYEVRAHRASVRPTTPNRRPVMGRHPEHARLHVFNGMGTKGVLQAPWCATHFREWLDGKRPEVLKELRLERFLKKIS